MKNKIGKVLCILSALLSLIALVLYGKVPMTASVVVPFLAAAAVLSVISILTSGKLPDPVRDLMPVAATALLAGALIYSVMPNVNQIGYVVAGLDDISSLNAFITAAAVMGAGLLASILAGFFEA